MHKFIYILFYVMLIFCIAACGSKSENLEDSNTAKNESVEEVADITQENLKQSKQDLLQKMANDLYLEAEKELEEAPAVQMDERGIYDDIKSVDVIVESPVILPTFDLGIIVEEENGNSSEDKTTEE